MYEKKRKNCAEMRKKKCKPSDSHLMSVNVRIQHPIHKSSLMNKKKINK